jgi:O-antigen/teichoic acid export membrane protein
VVLRALGPLASPTSRRRVLVMADQGASSLSNIVVGILAARALSAEAFGAFGVAWLAYYVAIGACRALVGEPLLSRYSHEPGERRAQRLSLLLGATVTVAVVAAVAAATASVLLDGASSAALLAFAAVVPVVLLQDAWRYVYVIDRAGMALAIDAAWLATVCIVLSLAPPGASAAWFVLAWGLSAAPAVLLAAAVDRQSLTWRWRPLSWLADERDTASRFFGEYVSAQAGQQATLAAVGGIAGLAALGAVRSAQILYGPLNTLHMGVYLAVVPDGVRTRSDPRRLRRLAVRATALVVAAAIAWTLVALAVPDSLGRWLFGATWAEGQDLVVPMGLAMIAGSAATGGFAGVRSLGDGRASLRARLTSLPGEFLLPVIGTVLGGAVGFALGFAAARAVTAVVWWRAFLVHGQRTARIGAEGTLDPPPLGPPGVPPPEPSPLEVVGRD